MKVIPIADLGLKPPSKYLVKPPLVLVRSNHYYLQYYLAGRKRPIVKSTGLPIVTDDTEKTVRKDIVDRLQAKIDEIVETRVMVKLGKRTVDLPSKPRKTTYEELLPLFNADNEKRRGEPRTKKTLLHRESAIRFLSRYATEATPGTVSEDLLYRIRDAAIKEDGYSAASVRGYFLELRALQDFAIAKGYAKVNPFRRVSITVKDRVLKSYKRADELKLYRFLWTANRGTDDRTEGWKVLKAILVIRLTLMRGQDACNLKQEWFRDLSTHEFQYWNGKRRSWENYRSCEALEKVLTWPGEDDFVLHFRSEKTLNDYLTNACEFAGVPVFTIHDIKRMSSDDLLALTHSDLLLALAAHHTPKGHTETLHKHYTRNKSPLATLLNEAFQWISELIDTLPDLPPDPDVYSFSRKDRKHKRSKASTKQAQKQNAT